MTGAPSGRFPGFSAAAQARHWDPVTAGVVLSRLRRPPDLRFFTPDQQAIATALCDRLLDQDSGPGGEPAVPVVAMIDARLAEQQTDGWRYADMPEDGPRAATTCSSGSGRSPAAGSPSARPRTSGP